MPLIKELLSTDVGLLSLFCIVFMIAMSIFMYFWIGKKVREDTKRHDLEQRTARKSPQT